MALPSVSEIESLREERTYLAPPENVHTDRLANGTPVVVRQSDVILPLGPRVRWGGIIGGCVVAVGLLMLLTALGMAVGLSAADDLWRMDTETIKDFATGVGLWTTSSLLAAFFMAGLVAAKITDRPDGGAFLHGMLTWVILSSFLSWLISSGMRPEVAGVSVRPNSALSSGASGTALTTLTEAELARSFGLDDPGQVSTRLTDPRIPLIVAAIAGLSAREAQALVTELQARVVAVQDDPAAVNAEVRNFISRLLEHARANAPETTAAFQRNAELGSWTLFGIMSLTLLVSVAGAFAGLPNRRRWQSTLVRA